MNKTLTPKQQLKAAEKLAASFPLFAGQLAPELPKLKEQVKEYGNRLPPEPAKFKVGDRICYQYWYYRLDPNYIGTVKEVSGGYDFNGVHNWFYRIEFDPMYAPAARLKTSLEIPSDAPIKEDKLTLLPEPKSWT